METYTRNIERGQGGACLLIVDPQVDFHPGGSLAIPTANQDAERIAALIRKHGQDLDEIYVTLDSHAKYHIAHPLFWTDKNGIHPEPFTVITLKDVNQDGKWMTSRKEAHEWALEYLARLEEDGKFTLTIWPEHCLISTPGHNVVPSIAGALAEWESSKLSVVDYVMKGNNAYTEHYSAIRAEVERKDDPKTQLNTELLGKLRMHSKVLLCGQAKSHCVNFTVRDLADNWDSSRMADLIVLEDGCSSVVGFESAGEKFIQDMRAKGLTISSCDAVRL